MCLGVPAKVVEVRDSTAIVDFGGVLREVDASFTPVKRGDYVIIHAGTVISKLDPEEAEETIKTWEEVLKSLAEEP